MMKCIAIDDEPIALSIVSRYCEQRGCIELETYSSPHLGMQRIREWMPDIVFLDIEMNGASGMPVLDERETVITVRTLCGCLRLPTGKKYMRHLPNRIRVIAR